MTATIYRCPHLSSAACSVCAELADARMTIERLSAENRKAVNALRNDRAKRSNWRKRAEAAEAELASFKVKAGHYDREHRDDHYDPMG